MQCTYPKVAGLDVNMVNEFQGQVINNFAARVFQLGSELRLRWNRLPICIRLFGFFRYAVCHEANAQLKSRWRRLESNAPLLPGPYAKMLACRPDLQVAIDWMTVPAVRHPRWRNTVMQSAFVLNKQRTNPDENTSG